MTEIDYRKDAEALCPTSGMVCSARVKLLNNYRPTDTDVSQEQLEAQYAWEQETGGVSDERKLQIKLTENAIAAHAIRCAGGDVCPVRVFQNNSTTRSLGVRAIRSLRATFSK
jgi:hypothetical protein